MNSEGYNTFHIAAEHRYSHILEIQAEHKQGACKDSTLEEQYLDRTTEDHNRLTALQIACRNKHKESVEVLLKYLMYLYKRQKYREEVWVHPYTYKQAVNANDLYELSKAIMFLIEQCLYTEEHEDILVRSLHQKYKSECYRTENRNIHIYEKLADSISKGCKFCISANVRKARKTTYECCCSSIFNIVGHFVYRSADLLPYVLHQDFINLLTNRYPKCSIRLLYRSYGMKYIDNNKMKSLVHMYWMCKNYETLVLLYVSGISVALSQNKRGRRVSVKEHSTEEEDSWRFLQSCIAQITYLEGDVSGLNKVQYVDYVVNQPRTLLNSCVITIRKEISSNVIKNAEQLPLPRKQKDAVILTNFQLRCSAACRCHGWRQEEHCL